MSVLRPFFSPATHATCCVRNPRSTPHEIFKADLLPTSTSDWSRNHVCHACSIHSSVCTATNRRWYTAGRNKYHHACHAGQTMN